MWDDEDFEPNNPEWPQIENQVLFGWYTFDMLGVTLNK